MAGGLKVPHPKPNRTSSITASVEPGKKCNFSDPIPDLLNQKFWDEVSTWCFNRSSR